MLALGYLARGSGGGMKMFLKFLTWIGLLIVLAGLVFSYSSSWVMVSRGQLGSSVGYVITALIGAVGTLLALIGGFIARPKYFWIGSLVVGIAYIASFYGYFFGYTVELNAWFVPGLLLMLLPGLACVVAGVVIWSLR